jgi:hypothetical protein
MFFSLPCSRSYPASKTNHAGDVTQTSRSEPASVKGVHLQKCIVKVAVLRTVVVVVIVVVVATAEGTVLIHFRNTMFSPS